MTSLSGIKVLDFSHALAGPYCTLLLADHGADVYKLESPDGGDMGRGWGPPFVGDQAAYFIGLNRGKRSVSVNLKCAQGAELCLRMMEKVDVVIENFRPGTMSRLGLGYEVARARNPRIVYCSISGCGQNGPSRDEPAMDLILQASSGLMSVTGTAEGTRVRCGYSVADVSTGMFASSIVPYRAFPTQDVDIVIAVGSEKLWRAFGPAIGHAELVDHPDYATNSLRVKNRVHLESFLAEIFCTDTMENWRAKLSAAGVPVSPIRRLDEVVNDPQCVVREMFPYMTDHDAGQVRVVGSPIKLPKQSAAALSSAPDVGQHTKETLSDWFGMDSTELNDLQAAGVIRQGENVRTQPQQQFF